MIELDSESKDYVHAVEAFKYAFSQVHGDGDAPEVAGVLIEKKSDGTAILRYEFEDGSAIEAVRDVYWVN